MISPAQAIEESKALLRDEANCLALEVQSDTGKALSHRAKCAIQLEIQRLRAVSAALDEPFDREMVREGWRRVT